MKLGMFLRQFDPFLLPSLIIGNVANADGSGTWPFFVDATHSKSDIQKLLSGNGIKSWGWGATIGGNWQFSVNRGQAEFAQDLMERDGMTILGRGLE